MLTCIFKNNFLEKREGGLYQNKVNLSLTSCRQSTVIYKRELSVSDIKKKQILNNNIGTFICVFEYAIVNLSTYNQFTNAA